MDNAGRGRRHMKPAQLPPKMPGGYYYHPFEFAICGFSGSGKTTLIEKLVGEFAAAGLSSAYMKHDAHVFDMDVEGKDTARAWKAGAILSAIQSPDKNAILSTGRFATWPTQAAAAAADILLVEGNKRSDIPKLFMLDDRGEGLAELESGSLQAVAGLAVAQASDVVALAARFPDLAIFARDDSAGIASFILQRLRSSAPPLQGVVLVGGRSTRMGTDKAALEIDGRSQARRMADLLAPFCARVSISCRPDQEVPADAAHLPRIFDKFQDLGPLGGILSAIASSPDAASLVLACDLPLLTEADVAALVAARNPFRHATAYTGVLRGEQIVEPLCTIYEPAFYALGLAAVARGISCPRKALAGGRVNLLEPREGALTNANTAQEWKEGLGKLEGKLGGTETGGDAENVSRAHVDSGAQGNSGAHVDSGASLAVGARGNSGAQDPGRAHTKTGAPIAEPAAGPASATAPGARSTLPRYPHEVESLLLGSAKLLASALVAETEEVPWNEAPGRVLAEDLVADLDQPPFERSAMDGIAVSQADVEAALRAGASAVEFAIVGVALAGGNPESANPETTATRNSAGKPRALEIQTGAALPAGYDAVIRLEDLDYPRGSATALLSGRPPKLWENVHRKGSDYGAGEVLEKAGAQLGPGHLALLASIGKTVVKVRRRPRISILATGTELVDPATQPGPGQIRSSNLETLQTLAQVWGVQVLRAARLPDERGDILDWISHALVDSDALVLTGGVSKGRTDYIPGIAEELAGTVLVKGLSQRPGKPLFVSSLPSGPAEPPSTPPKLLFGLPGNPVSAVVNFRRFVLPTLALAAAAEPPDAHSPVPPGYGPAVSCPDIAAGLSRKPDLTHFVAVKLTGSYFQGVPEARAIFGNGSGDFSHLAQSDGFVEVPADGVKAGPRLPAPLYSYYSWQPQSGAATRGFRA